MRVLFIGDIVGSPGRRIVLERLADVVANEGVDLVIANGENAASGFGITPRLVEELLGAGIEVLTGGNHIWDRKEILDYLPHQPRLLRPANYPPNTPGAGLWVGVINDVKTAVINLMGRVFMPPSDDPFRAADQLLASLPPDTRVCIVDMHGEATSEKVAMGWYLDGRVSAVLGTHTHVQTADERILPHGTAYLTDIGMTGSYSGVIGMNKSDTIARFTSVVAKRADQATGEVRICAVVVDVDETTGRARDILRLNLEHES